jgi:hypothetical protein
LTFLTEQNPHCQTSLKLSACRPVAAAVVMQLCPQSSHLFMKYTHAGGRSVVGLVRWTIEVRFIFWSDALKIYLLSFRVQL